MVSCTQTGAMKKTKFPNLRTHVRKGKAGQVWTYWTLDVEPTHTNRVQYQPLTAWRVCIASAAFLQRMTMKFLQRLFCQHYFAHMRNIYGDEINMAGGNRSIWKCAKCDKERLFPMLYCPPSTKEQQGT